MVGDEVDAVQPGPAAENLTLKLESLLAHAVRLLKASGGDFYLFEWEQPALHWVTSLPANPDSTTLRRQCSAGIAALAARAGQPLLISDYRTWPLSLPLGELEPPFYAAASNPLQVQGRVRGVINVWKGMSGSPFTPADLELLAVFADQAALTLENNRLFESERTQLLLVQTLQSASALLTTQSGLHEMLEDIIDLLSKTVPCDSISIHLLDSDGVLNLAAGRGFRDLDQTRKMVREISTHSLESKWNSRQVIVISDTGRDPRWLVKPGTEHIRSWVGAPLLVKGRFIGCLNVDSSTVNAFDARTGETVMAFANQAAIAIDNARLFEQAATERRHLSLLYDISREVTSSLDCDEILTRAITLTCQALHGLVGQAFLYQPQESRLSLRALHGRQSTAAEADTRLHLTLGVGLAGWAGQQRQPANVPEVAEDPRWLHIIGLDEDVHSAITSPILEGRRLWGVLTVLHEQPNAFSNDHVPLLQAICQEVGLALSNANRYQEAQRRLAEITIIQKLAQTFTQQLELDVLLNEVVTQLGQQLGYPQVEIFMVEAENLILRAYYGQPPELDCIRLNRGVLGRVARSGQPALLTDVTQDPDYIPCLQSIVAELAAPIFRRERVVGVINIQTHISGQLGKQDRELVEVLAGQVSVALDNAVLYERVRRHAEELEHIVAQRTAELTELYQLSQEIGYVFSYDGLLRLLLRHLHSAANCDWVMGCLSPNGCRSILLETDLPLAPSMKEELHQLLEQLHEQLEHPVPPEGMLIEIIPSVNYQEAGPPLTRIGALMRAPIYADNRLLGMVLAGSQWTGTFGAEQNRLLTTFANQAATAVQSLQAVLAAQQKHLESLVEHLPVGTLLFGPDFRLLVANRLGREILALLSPGYENQPLRSLGSTPLQALIEHQFDPLPVEIELGGPPRRMFEAQVRPVGEADLGEKSQWVLTVREVTQERENQFRIQSQERLATVGQLAAGIAHDFNNIMAAILVYADLLRSDRSIQKASQDKLEIIQQQVQRASSLIRQILDFSRRSVMDQIPLDLLPFIKELDKLLKRILPETISLELAYQPGSYFVRGDPTRLQQVFMNLAVNAKDAMPEGGRLRFELAREHLALEINTPIPDMPPGDWIRIVVADTGTGIPPEMRPHIFEPFFTTKSVGQGTGLGLAQVYGIVKAHEGYIDFDSRPGAGTSFVIYLPALPPEARPEPNGETLNRLIGNGETILLVEDDAATLNALKALLESQNYRVVTALNGAQALQCFAETGSEIVLVISDVVMPQMGGLDLYKIMQERWPKVRMLFITGHPVDLESQALLQAAQVHWLQKPFSIKEFNQVLRALLR